MLATNAILRLPGALRWLALAACLPLAACGDAERDLAAAEQARREQSAFLLEQQGWRDQRRSELVAPEGWTTLTGLHWLANGSHYVGSDADNGIRLAIGPAHLGLLHVRDGQVRFSGERGVALTLDGQPLRGAATLRTDRDPAGASRLGFDDGKGVATVIWSYPRGEAVTKDGETAIDVAAYAAHIAALLGAHIIKIKLSTDHLMLPEAKKVYEKEQIDISTMAARVKHCVQSSFNGRRIIVFSGGAAKGADAVYDDARAILAGGGNGSIIGRNSFQRSREDALAMLGKLVDIYLGKDA